METKRASNNGHLTSGRGYIFDDYLIDPANRVLLRSGRVVPLTGRVFDVLLVLAENSGRLLSKDELIESVWHDEFVEEGNLARNVSTLRKALGDNGKEHKYIVTVQGRGYRFIADVHEFDPVRENVNGNGIPADRSGGIEKPAGREARIKLPGRFSHGSRADRSGRFWLFSLGVFVLLGLVLAGLQMGFSLIKAKDGLALDNIRQIKLTQSGNVITPVISADGRYLAYLSIDRNGKGLCLRQLATGSVLQLVPERPETDYWGIDIAPDNSFVYYVFKDANTDYGGVYRIPLLGGTPHKLVGDGVAGLAVSPDGGRIAFLRVDRQAGTESIFVVNNDGSDERAVTSVRLDSLYYSLGWSPDGQSLIYTLKQHEPDGDHWYIAEISADGGPEIRIGEPSRTLISSTKWLPDKGGLISNMIDETSRQPQLYYVSYPDGARRKITNDPDGSSGVALTADGKTIVTNRSNSNRQVWTLSEPEAGTGLQITSGAEQHVESVAWVENEYLIFDEAENSTYDNFNIWKMRADGSEREQITFGKDNNTQPAVSPNGQTIVYVSRKSGKRQIWRMGLHGEDPLQLTSIAHGVFDPRFSGDGNTVFFIASVAGKNQVWRVPASGGDASPVSEADTYNVWDVSSDGSELAYLFFDETASRMRTRIQRLDTEMPDKVMDFRPETWMRWSSDGHALYFNSAGDNARNVWRQDMNGSPAKQVTNFPDEQIFKCAWSPDTSQMACIRQTITFDAVMIRLD